MPEKKEYFSKPPSFINREKEKEYILEYLNSTPTSILWLYWPKSTWKTTLISKILDNNLDDSFVTMNINFRRMLIAEYDHFIDAMFWFSDEFKSKNKFDYQKIAEDTLKMYEKDVKTYKRKSEIDFWVIKVSEEVWKNLKERRLDVFQYTIKILRELQKRWKQPVIIFDEIQELKWIYYWEWKHERELLREVFAFFIALTKELHLAHIICMTSESTFIEQIYNDVKLKNTSEFYFIDHLEKKDIEYRLWEIEWFTKSQVELFWEYLWWSVQEIWLRVVRFRNLPKEEQTDEKLKELLEQRVMEEYARVFDFIILNSKKKFESEEDKQKVLDINKIIVEKWEYIIWKDWLIDFDTIAKMVELDIWFYNVLARKITANSESVRQAFKKMIK